MSQENVEVIRDQYAAVNERDFGRAMGHYADDVVLEAPPRRAALRLEAGFKTGAHPG
jgi:ketosteroid isomerase-like protein